MKKRILLSLSAFFILLSVIVTVPLAVHSSTAYADEATDESTGQATDESTKVTTEESTEETGNPPGTYVGGQENSPAYSAYYSAPAIFVTPKDNYDKVKSGGSMDSSQIEVAYCINKKREAPLNYLNGQWAGALTNNYYLTSDGYNLYNKSTNVTGTDLSNALDNPREGIDETELRNRVISVLLNGYPLNYSGLNTDKNGDPILEDSAFRAVTQWALWYYTDAYDWDYMSEEEQSVYQALIDTLLPDSVTHHSVSAVDLYLWDGNPAFSAEAQIYNYPYNGKYLTGYPTLETGLTDPNYEKGYQNLLAANTSGLKAFSFSKEDVDGNALTGATIELQDKDGNVMASWDSDGTVHTFNVFTGSYNLLVETNSPDGYAIADPISITVNQDGSIYKDGQLVDNSNPIVMVDERLFDFQFSKQDTDGKELAGATIELRDANGKAVETWTSDGTVHKFSAVAGTYTLVETKAPEDYKTADPITITIKEDGTIEKDGVAIDTSTPVVMVDEALPHFQFSKQDADGKDLAGATIELQNANGKAVKTWTSDGSEHKFSAAAGTYTLVETKAPDGYEIADPIPITIKEDGTIEKDGVAIDTSTPVVMVDEIKKTEETKTDDKDNTKNAVNKDKSSSNTNPPTGDSNDPVLWTSLLLAGFTGVVIAFRKRRTSFK